MKRLDEIETVRESPTYAPGPNGPVYQGVQKRVVKVQVKSISAGWRFMHYLIDLAVLYGIQYGIGWVIGLWLVDQNIYLEEIEITFLGYGIGVLSYSYYFVMETVFQQSIGKMVSQSVVVDEYGNKPTAWQVFLRSISRAVPFEQFSCLGTPSRGWHDKWASTYVIRKEDLAMMKRKLAEQTEQDASIYESMITDESLTI